MNIGQSQKVEIEAGKMWSTGIDIQKRNSIINVSIRLDQYDIKFGLFRAVTSCEFKSTEIKDKDGVTKDHVEHILDGESPFSTIIDYKMIDTSDSQDITINYFASEPGFYRLVFNNDHSWVRAKTVLYRICALMPVVEDDKSGMATGEKQVVDLLDMSPEEKKDSHEVREVDPLKTFGFGVLS